ncbi:hypothetical protein IAR50_001494 [Cryptococcus sp. DSM 104548]
MTVAESEYLAFLAWQKANSQAAATPPAPTCPLPGPDTLAIDTLASQTRNISIQPTGTATDGGRGTTAQPPTFAPAPPAISSFPTTATRLSPEAVYIPPASRSSTLVAQIPKGAPRPSDKESWRPGAAAQPAQANGAVPPKPVSAGAGPSPGLSMNGAWGQPLSPVAQAYTPNLAPIQAPAGWGSPTAPATPLTQGQGGGGQLSPAAAAFQAPVPVPAQDVVARQAPVATSPPQARAQPVEEAGGWGRTPSAPISRSQSSQSTLPPPPPAQAQAPRTTYESGGWDQPFPAEPSSTPLPVSSTPAPPAPMDDAGGWDTPAPTATPTARPDEQSPGWGVEPTEGHGTVIATTGASSWDTPTPSSTPLSDQPPPAKAPTKQTNSVQQTSLSGREYVAWQPYVYTAPVQPVSEILEKFRNAAIKSRRGRDSSFANVFSARSGSNFGVSRDDGYQPRGATGGQGSRAVPIVAPAEGSPKPSGSSEWGQPQGQDASSNQGGGDNGTSSTTNASASPADWGAAQSQPSEPTPAPPQASSSAQEGWGTSTSQYAQGGWGAAAPEQADQGGWGQSSAPQAPQATVQAPSVETSQGVSGASAFSRQPPPHQASPPAAAAVVRIHPARLAMLGGAPRPSNEPPVDSYGPPSGFGGRDSGDNGWGNRGGDSGWGSRARNGGGNGGNGEPPSNNSNFQPPTQPASSPAPPQTGAGSGAAPGIHPSRLAMMSGGFRAR